eukprot:scaffold187928_cov15-Tisochrysis_lutea.AAC.1
MKTTAGWGSASRSCAANVAATKVLNIDHTLNQHAIGAACYFKRGHVCVFQAIPEAILSVAVTFLMGMCLRARASQHPQTLDTGERGLTLANKCNLVILWEACAVVTMCSRVNAIVNSISVNFKPQKVE